MAFETRVPELYFTPYSWAKLNFMRDAGKTEVGGFGVCPTIPTVIEDLYMPTQECSVAFCEFDDLGIREMYKELDGEKGYHPLNFSRIWIHTHPGSSPEPSGQDEETFRERFSDSDWAIMFILARGGESYARLKLNSKSLQPIEMKMKVFVDWGRSFPAADHENWKREYLAKVREKTYQSNYVNVYHDHDGRGGFSPNAGYHPHLPTLGTASGKQKSYFGSSVPSTGNGDDDDKLIEEMFDLEFRFSAREWPNLTEREKRIAKAASARFGCSLDEVLAWGV